MHLIFFVFLGISQLVYSARDVSDEDYAEIPNIFHMDNYDKCMLKNEKEAFYCSFKYELEPLFPKDLPKIWKTIEKLRSSKFNYRHDYVRHSICVADTCPGMFVRNETDPVLWKHLQDCYDDKYFSSGLKGKVTQVICQSKLVKKRPIDWLDISVAVVFVAYVIFILFCTFYEGVYRYRTEEEYQNNFVKPKSGKIIAAFSLTRNWIRLKTVNSTPDIERFRGIQGIRVYNFFLVVLSHSTMTFFYGPVQNSRYVERINEKFLNIFLSSGPLCVSTFFLMAGWLLSSGIFEFFEGKEMNPKFIIIAFLNRFIRLTPALAVMVLFHSTWLTHFFDGPLVDKILGLEYKVCRKNGWANLLYIHNYINREEMCIMQTWYLGIDTQLFLIALILLYYMKKNEKNIPYILGGPLIFHMIVVFCINYFNNYESTVMPYPESLYEIKVLEEAQWHQQVGSLYGNMPGLIIGLGFGYIYYKTKNTKIYDKKYKVVIWWIVSLLFPLGIIIFPGLIIYNPEVPQSPFWAAVYVSVCRIIFSIGIANIILGLTQKIGWITRFICEWSPLYVLGRLVYSSFLVHVVFIKIRPALIRAPVFVDDYLLIVEYFSDLFTSFLAGAILTLLVEMPISELQKLLVPQKSSVTKTDKKDSKKIKEDINKTKEAKKEH